MVLWGDGGEGKEGTVVCAEGARRGGGSVCADDPGKPEWKRGCMMRPGRWSGERWWRLGREGSCGLGVQAESRLLGVKPCVGAAACLSRLCPHLKPGCSSPLRLYIFHKRDREKEQRSVQPLFIWQEMLPVDSVDHRAGVYDRKIVTAARTCGSWSHGPGLTDLLREAPGVKWGKFHRLGNSGESRS